MNKASFVDYPPHIAAVLFTKGCNMTCPYCHNVDLLTEEQRLSRKEIMTYLDKRRAMLDAVVISGGEPTLHPALPEWLEDIKQLGYLVKLDTNGSNPTMLKDLMDKELIDYVAMDIKTVPEKYEALSGLDFSQVAESIDLVRQFASSEFRTTVYPELTWADLETLCRRHGEDTYYLQQYRPTPYSRLPAYRPEDLQGLATRYGVSVRGL